MIPDKFNMVDMGGIDLIMMQGESVPGLYDKLMAAISNCRYQCLYNWLFDGVLIPPTYVQLEDVDGEVFLNECVSVTSDDVIHIYSVAPGPVNPEIIPLLAEENGVYNVPSGKDGFNPVTVDVPSYTPVINPISITENGTYTAPSGVDGYSPVTVNVQSVGTIYACHIWTHTTGGTDASVWVQEGVIENGEFVPLSEAESVLFTTVNNFYTKSKPCANGKFMLSYEGNWKVNTNEDYNLDGVDYTYQPPGFATVAIWSYLTTTNIIFY